MDICLLAYELGASASDAIDPTEAAAPRPAFAVTFDSERASLGALRRTLNSWAPLWSAPAAHERILARLAAGLAPTTTEEAALN
jgi:hypothetical protein